ncbi:acetoacetate--CoA ligase [Geodermatophilus amargosae]|uniref:acetoacetate--CoA ligase n=1 Tax=Geodermatophilus amargosae TaxID=1296565 RepID=UPI0034DE1971
MTLAPAVAQLTSFRARCEEVTGTALDTPGALHAFSVERPEEFWRTLLDWSGVPWSGSADVVLTGTDVETARFFPDLRLNYAEALLRPLDGAGDDAPALTAVHADRPADSWTRGELRDAVARTVTALQRLGLAGGDRVVLIAGNTGETAVVALAAAAIGAAVSTAAPDMGVASLLGRFGQVDPAVLVLDRRAIGDDVVAEVVAGLPTLRRVLLLDDGPLPDLGLPVDRLADSTADAEPTRDWPRHAFDTPLFVMFSSGTTGPPKAMVHGAGGTLLEHVKEHRLHVDLGPGDTLYFHTTTAWMMWTWQLSALATGAHVVVNDGPVTGPETLWRLAADTGVTVFGTSPAYLQLGQDAGLRPAGIADLSRLRAVLSTGAVLHDWQFDWVTEAVGPVPLQSISGGTDIIGCFVLGAPDLPVRRGRSQTRSLGLDVAAVDEDGREVVGQVGELVCRRPFPSRPVGFLRDPDGRRFHDAYFADHAGMWTHGDLVEFDADGSSRLHGRSDGVLNVDGLRIGPSEIYTVLRQLPEIADAMAVEQRDDSRPGGARMVLLVVLRPGARLDGGLDRTIRRTLRREASAAHVPSLVVAVGDLPLTHNGKRSERAARDAVNGDPIANAVALRDPGCLDEIRRAVAAVAAAAAAPAASEDDDGLLGRVSRIWCEVLGLRSADPDDDWSDLGGTSRQVLSLLRRVRLELDADVPVQRFAEDPTPAGLTRAAEAAASAAPAGVAVLRAGEGRPVVLVPDAWGQLNLYAGLVDRLTTPRPVLGLRLPLRDAAGRHRTVEEVAADALAQVRSAQPQGPYTLLGYSFGGLVAYEVATRLRAAGEEVGCLGLLDARPPRAALGRRETARVRWAGRWATVRSGAALRRVVRRRRPSGPAAAPAAPDAELAFFRGSQAVSEAYRPGRFDGPVTYFLAEGSRAAASRTLGAWRRRVRELRVVDVPGHHGDLDDERIGMLSDRHVGTLAAHVSSVLE